MPRNWLSWVSQPIYFPVDLCTTSDHPTPVTNQAKTKEISCSKWKLLNSLSRKTLQEFNVSKSEFFDYLKNTFYTTCLSSAIICVQLKRHTLFFYMTPWKCLYWNVGIMSCLISWAVNYHCIIQARKQTKATSSGHAHPLEMP